MLKLLLTQKLVKSFRTQQESSSTLGRRSITTKNWCIYRNRVSENSVLEWYEREAAEQAQEV
eukprot:5493821-Prorocentrum_lima.AAC.1